jgi:poly-gamma-glutamate capsule biosynthesis protein CapA/YwtB (metallophosphatase superfamily)
MSQSTKTEGKHAWKVAIAGELMATLPFSMHKEPEFLKIKEKLDSADFCYGHLEMLFGDFNTAVPGRMKTGGSHLLADPVMAKEMRWLGIDIVSLCHNHGGDFGAAVALQTRDIVREAGIVGAGVGESLEEARDPGYMNVEAGRVALVALSSGNDMQDIASLNKGSMPPRPGQNPLRTKMRYKLPEDVYENLRKVAKRLNVLQEDKKTGDFIFTMQGDRRTCAFSKSDDYGIDSEIHHGDFEGNLLAIQEARPWSDFVMVAHHCQVSEGGRGNTPTTFVREFAHAAVDAGADMYVGHGWHKMLGVEIYKGKPIFYGLGDFFYQSQFIRRVPLDGYEGFGHDISNPAALRPHLEPLHSNSGSEVQPDRVDWWMSCLIEAEYKSDGLVKAINFYPVEMGVDFSDPSSPRITRTSGNLIEGRPFLASGENAKFILGKLQNVSKPFGTEIKIVGDIGRWEA